MASARIWGQAWLCAKLWSRVSNWRPLSFPVITGSNISSSPAQQTFRARRALPWSFTIRLLASHRGVCADSQLARPSLPLEAMIIQPRGQFWAPDARTSALPLSFVISFVGHVTLWNPFSFVCRRPSETMCGYTHVYYIISISISLSLSLYIYIYIYTYTWKMSGAVRRSRRLRLAGAPQSVRRRLS